MTDESSAWIDRGRMAVPVSQSGDWDEVGSSFKASFEQLTQPEATKSRPSRAISAARRSFRPHCPQIRFAIFHGLADDTRCRRRPAGPPLSCVIPAAVACREAALDHSVSGGLGPSEVAMTSHTGRLV
ncbi:unnamed protein product [Protopolystoma xenopodis]|uniref:Uncharacterized protein n=1 Tax=Protopolystoma xenopodis TaxID=117903 RepID=A0A448WIE4_9PLAT|nr:unnamed protein product [Protopolystoma xenopodis]